jgi:hypothetical protein
LLSYLTDPTTELSWASCHVHLEGGSTRRIPFLPVVSRKRAPLGTNRFSQNIRIDAPIVFVGNGIVRSGRFNAYADLDAAGKVVLLAYDFPDEAHAELEKEVSLEERIREALSRKVAGIVLFSAREDTPFPMFREQAIDKIPEVPVIVVNRRSAEVILAAAGLDAAPMFEKWRGEGTFSAEALIARLDLRIDGAFAEVERPAFTIMFEKTIDPARIDGVVAANEKSVAFAADLFKDTKVTWRKSFLTYFRDYDSKAFYTHHWGRGLSSDAGGFMVFDPTPVNFGLAVHENTHTLLGDNWGGSSSFMNEGLARYAEAMATVPEKDHVETLANIRKAKLFPIAEMLGMDIGRSPRTEIAYPAAGSFVGYLIATYGVDAVKNVYRLEGREQPARCARTAGRALQHSLNELEASGCAGWPRVHR